MPARPAAVAFDALQTVFSLEPVRGRLTAAGLPAHALEVWFARTLRDGFALAAAGSYQPFLTVAGGTLAGLFAEHGQPDADPAPVLDAFAELPAHPDAGPAFARLKEAGLTVLVLSNGSHSNTKTLLKAAGLYGSVDRIVSIDDAGAWKPRAEVYAYAAGKAGVEPGRLALVAAHAWDCHGAKRAGLVAGWVGRVERVFNPALGEPDVRADSLTGVADALLALPGE